MYSSTIERKPIALTFLVTSKRFDQALEDTFRRAENLKEQAELDPKIDGSFECRQEERHLILKGWRNTLIYIAQPLLDQLKHLNVIPLVYETDYDGIEYNESLVDYIWHRASFDEAFDYISHKNPMHDSLGFEAVEAFKPLLPIYNDLIIAYRSGQEHSRFDNPVKIELARKMLKLVHPELIVD